MVHFTGRNRIMHMADTLISPAVGGVMWAVSAGLLARASRRVSADTRNENGLVPLMGVLGAFVFAAQMINFTIPGTGSSGHLSGALLLAMLLGPNAAFLAIASVLTVQALFFGDGGLLALGCNIFNMGFFACYVGWPLIAEPLARRGQPSATRVFIGALLGAVVSLQLGAFAVVLQTSASGIAALPFSTFALLMQPIHLAIGLVEGVVTALVALFVWRARPELLGLNVSRPAKLSLRTVVAVFAALAVFTGGLLSWYASENPDGLEWSMLNVSGKEELEGPNNSAHALAARVQGAVTLMPDYAFAEGSSASPTTGTSVAGLLGGGLTLLLAAGLAFVLRRRQG